MIGCVPGSNLSVSYLSLPMGYTAIFKVCWNSNHALFSTCLTMSCSTFLRLQFELLVGSGVF